MDTQPRQPSFPDAQREIPQATLAAQNISTYSEFTRILTALITKIHPRWTVSPRGAPLDGASGEGSFPRLEHHLRSARPIRNEPKPIHRVTNRLIDEKGRQPLTFGQRVDHVIQFDCLGRNENEAEDTRAKLQRILHNYTGWFKHVGVGQMFWDEFPVSQDPTRDEPITRATRWQVQLEELHFQYHYTIEQVRLDIYSFVEKVENERVEHAGPGMIDTFAHGDIWQIIGVGETQNSIHYWDPIHYTARSDGLEWVIPDPPVSYFVTYVYFTAPTRIYPLAERGANPELDHPALPE